MDNRVLFGIMVLIFNNCGVPCFMQGYTRTGIKRIVLGCLTLGVIGVINWVKGIFMGIDILTMSDAEYQSKKGTFINGVPGVEELAAPAQVQTAIPTAVQTPEPAVVQTAVPTAVQTPAPAVVQTPTPATQQTAAPVKAFCGGCGNRLSASDIFCPFCGKKIG